MIAQDYSKPCRRCFHPFRCPIEQAARFYCRACESITEANAKAQQEKLARETPPAPAR